MVIQQVFLEGGFGAQIGPQEGDKEGHGELPLIPTLSDLWESQDIDTNTSQG